MFQVWPDLIEGKLHEYFITFPIDHRYQRPVTSLSKKEVKVKCIKLFTRSFSSQYISSDEYVDFQIAIQYVRYHAVFIALCML